MYLNKVVKNTSQIIPFLVPRSSIKKYNLVYSPIP